MPNDMAPHKAVVLVRVKSHKLAQTGECIPPATSDTGNLIYSIDGKDKKDLDKKVKEFLEKVKQCLTQ